jgi:hypothetical protein
LRTQPDLVGFSTDYSATEVVHEPYSGNTIILNERNHTWFCVQAGCVRALAGELRPSSRDRAERHGRAELLG